MLDLETVSQIMPGYLPEPHATLMNGILLGLPISDPLLNQQLKDTGLIHLAVLSGTNISLLITLLSSLTQSFPKKLSLVISIASILAFVMYVGPQAPIVRACIMGVTSQVGVFFGRKTLPFYSLLVSGLVTAILWPEWVGTISYYLSYAATCGILLFSKPQVNNPPKPLLSTLCGYVKEELRVTLAAQLFTVPIIYFYFKQVSVISPITNVLISWTVAPLMYFGFLAILLNRVHLILGIIPSFVCFALSSVIIFVAEVGSFVPFSSLKF